MITLPSKTLSIVLAVGSIVLTGEVRAAPHLASRISDDDPIVTEYAQSGRMRSPEIIPADWEAWLAAIAAAQDDALGARAAEIRLTYQDSLAKSAEQFRRDLAALDLAGLKAVQESAQKRMREVPVVEASDADAVKSRRKELDEIRAEPEATGVPFQIRQASSADAARRYAAMEKAIRGLLVAAQANAEVQSAIQTRVDLLFARAFSEDSDVMADYYGVFDPEGLIGEVSKSNECVAKLFEIQEGGALSVAANGAGSDLLARLREYRRARAELVADVCAEFAAVLNRGATASTQEELTEIGLEFEQDPSTRKIRRTGWALQDGLCQQIASDLGELCGDDARDQFLGAYGEAVARRSCHRSWLSDAGSKLLTDLQLDAATKTTVTEILDRFSAADRKARAEFANRAMQIRRRIAARVQDAEAYAKMHRSAYTALWRPHQEAIAELTAALAGAAANKFTEAIEAAKRDDPVRFGGVASVAGTLDP